MCYVSRFQPHKSYRMEDWKPVPRKYDPLKAGSIDGTDTYPHDKAIIRAMNAKYKPDKTLKGDPSTTIFIGRLNPQTSEETLEQVFSRFGKIKQLRLIRDIVTGFSKRYAFIEYEDERSADKAEYDANHSVIDQTEVIVMLECSRTMPGWVPRRFGGGLNGKKESGQLRFGGQERPFRKPILLANQQAQRRAGYGHSNDNGSFKDYRNQERGKRRYDNNRDDRYRDRSPRRDRGRSPSPKRERRREERDYSGRKGRY